MHLFIVARPHHDLYDYLRERLSGNGDVTVIADRRLAARRRRAAPAAAERRRAERRTRPEIDEQLRAHSHAIVSLPPAARPSRDDGRPLRDTLQWIEGVQNHVTAVRAVLYEHDRVQREIDELRQTHARLRDEADRSGQELEHVEAELARTIATAKELLARLRSDRPAPRAT